MRWSRDTRRGIMSYPQSNGHTAQMPFWKARKKIGKKDWTPGCISPTSVATSFSVARQNKTKDSVRVSRAPLTHSYDVTISPGRVGGHRALGFSLPWVFVYEVDDLLVFQSKKYHAKCSLRYGAFAYWFLSTRPAVVFKQSGPEKNGQKLSNVIECQDRCVLYIWHGFSVL